MNRDREVYGDDVDDFKPERHLDLEGNLKDPSGEGHYTYGFGQRYLSLLAHTTTIS
jgi:hypothetical protein